MDMDRKVEFVCSFNHPVNTQELWFAIFPVEGVKIYPSTNETVLEYTGNESDMHFIIRKLEEATVGLHGGLSMIIKYLT